MSTKKKAAPKTAKAKANTKAKATAKAQTIGRARRPATAAPAKAQTGRARRPATAAPAAPAEPTAPAAPEKKLSLLNAALEVLKSGEESLTTRQMVAAAKERGLWTPGSGKTPEQTLYSAIMREIRDKGDASRFVKDARGHFKARA